MATKIPNAALRAMGLEPTDLLHAAEWEIKVAAHHLEKKFNLKFWAATILKIIELRNDLNTYIRQENIDTEVTSEIENKRIVQKITKKLKMNLDLSKLNNRPSIFDPTWKAVLREFPLKINTFISEKKLTYKMTLITTNEQQETLNRIKEEYIERQKKTNLDSIQPDLLTEHLITGVNSSLTSRLFRIKIRLDILKKNNFSATKKWLNLDFSYPRNIIEKSASTIQKMKIPGNYKAKLLKHNIAGYFLPQV